MSSVTPDREGSPPGGPDPDDDQARTGPWQVSTRDVARLAKVSRGTVSNVLNHPDRVSPARRAAVQAAIEELGFVRHEGARHLRAGYSSTVGLLLLDAWNPGFMEVARGVEDTTIERGLSVLISNSARDTAREQTYLRLYTERRVAGMIVIPHDHFGEDIRRIRSDGMPVVMVDRAETGRHGLSVAIDDVTGGALAAGHLLGLGHTRLAFVGAASAATPVQDRLTGVRKALAEGGGAAELTVIDSDLTADAGRLVGEQLAVRPRSRRPTGVIAAIDLVAFGVLQGLLQHGVRVPEDLSLVGYDDVPFARQLSVPLTTVNRPHYTMGTTAAEMLVAAISGRVPEQRHVVFPPALVVRESTAKPPLTD